MFFFPLTADARSGQQEASAWCEVYFSIGFESVHGGEARAGTHTQRQNDLSGLQYPGPGG